MYSESSTIAASGRSQQQRSAPLLGGGKGLRNCLGMAAIPLLGAFPRRDLPHQGSWRCGDDSGKRNGKAHGSILSCKMLTWFPVR